MVQPRIEKNSVNWRSRLHIGAGVWVSTVISLLLVFSISVFALQPGVPTDLQATAGYNEVDLTWVAPEDDGGFAITDYTIEYSLSGADDWNVFADEVSADTTATVTGLTVEASYDFRVSAINEEESTSDPSATATATVLNPAPGAPTDLQATAGVGEVELSWTAPSWTGSSAIIDYSIQYSVSGQGDWTVFSDDVSTNTTATVVGLSGGVSYDFRIFAINDTETSLASSTQTATPYTIPDAPTDVSATRGNAQATVTFSAPASNGGSAITGYTVTSSPGNITASGEASPIIVTGLDNGTSYTFTVVATNAAGDSDPSQASNSVTPATVPGAPTAVSGTPGNEQVSVVFTAPASNGGSAITSYTVTSTPGNITASGESSPITVTGLDNGTSYSFTVTATNDVGEGAASAASGDVTPRTVPGAPNNVSAARGNGEATISFDAPASNGGATITSYTVTSSPGGLTGTGATSPVQVTGLDNGTAYTFTVVATNAAGNSEPSQASNSVTPATVPGVPSGLSATGGAQQAELMWEAPAANGEPITGYVVEYSVAGENDWQVFTDGALEETSATVTDLADGTEYDFRVAAVNAVGQGGYAIGVASTFDVPGAPTGVSGTPGNQQVSVAFTAPASNGGSAITGYTVTSTPGNITASGESSPITVTGLDNGTAYTFTVTATNAIGTSGPSTPSDSVTPRTVPGVPTSLVTTPGNEQVELSWTAPVSNGGSEITDYIVQYKPSADETWTVFSDGTSTDTSAVVTGLSNGAAYDFRVAAVNIAGTSSYGSVSSSTPHTTPDAPTNASATRGNAQATVTFTAPDSDGGSAITGYTVTSSPGNITASGESSPITVTGLDNGTAYTFTVVATNTAGDSEPSQASNSVTPATVPGVPTGVSGTPGNSQVSVSFTAPADDGGTEITGYTVTSTPGGITASGTTSPIVVTGLDNGTSYTFTVTATNDVGEGAASAASAAVVPHTTPGVPTDVSAEAGNAQATVTFSAPASNGGSAITGYTVTSTPGNITASGESSPITVTGLDNGTAYTFTVVATNTAGDSDPSQASNSVTPAAVPDAPDNFAATPGSTQIALSWDTPNNNGSDITGYIVQYKPSADTTWITFDDGTSVTTDATITNLTNGTEYDFRVAAISEVGTGAYSDIVSSTPYTLPGTPTDVVPTPGNEQVSLLWDSPASNGGSAITDYIVQYKLSSGDEWVIFSDGTSPAVGATVTELTNGTSYDFRVAAVNEAGTGSYSSPATSTPYTTPEAPTNASATRGNAQATVTFTAPDSDGGSAITGYTVTSNPGNITASGESSPITVTGLDNGTSYTFTVVATNAAGDSDPSQATNSVTPATVPGAPTGVVPVAGVSQVGLSWTAPAANGGSAVTDYVVEYKVSTDTSWTVFADGESTDTNVTVAGLANGTAYDFRVAAVNEIGVGEYSVTASSTPRTVPGSPTGLQAAPGNTRVTLSWTTPATNGGSAITDYVVEYKLSSGDTWTVFADGESADTTTTVTGLTNEVAYDFRLTAVNIAGAGTASEAITATPDLTFTTISQIQSSSASTAATITWETDVASNSQVEYGPDTSYGNVTAVSETDGVTTHSVTLTGLQSCTTYNFRVISQPVEDGGTTTSDNQTVSTKGCVGNETVAKEEVAAIPAADGGTVTLTDGTRSLTVELPADYTDTDTVLQVKKLSGAPTGTTGLPASGVVAVAGQVYEIKAVLPDSTLITEFDQPITITVQYADSDVADIDESTLTIHNWHNGSWTALTDCVVDQDANTVTCTTTHFSLFMLFGQAIHVEDEEDTDSKTDDTDSTGSDSSTTTSPTSTSSTNGSDDVKVNEDKADTEASGQPSKGENEQTGDETRGEDKSLLLWLGAAGIIVVIGTIVAINAKRQRGDEKWQ